MDLCCVCLKENQLFQENACHSICCDCYKRVIKINHLCPICRQEYSLTRKEIKQKLTKHFRYYWSLKRRMRISMHCQSLFFMQNNKYVIYNTESDFDTLTIQELIFLYEFCMKIIGNNLWMQILAVIRRKTIEIVNTNEFIVNIYKGKIMVRF